MSTPGLYFDSSFQGHPTCLSVLRKATWPYGNIWLFWPFMTICPYGQCPKKVGMWGIPEKYYQNVAQEY